MTRAPVVFLAVLAVVALGAGAYALGLSPGWGLVALLGLAPRRGPAAAERRANETSAARRRVEVKRADDERAARLKTNALDDLNTELRRKRGGA